MSESKSIVLVSGLPRSGTSLMMRMLAAGGMAVLADNLRAPDQDNPSGYYELEAVKRMAQGEVSWLEGAGGKAVKVIAPLLIYLPPEKSYRIIFMQRDMVEILASQRTMLQRRGAPADEAGDDEIGRLFGIQLTQIRNWLARQTNLSVLEVDFKGLVLDPDPTIDTINQFLGGDLGVEAMRAVIDPSLYRHRAS